MPDGKSPAGSSSGASGSDPRRSAADGQKTDAEPGSEPTEEGGGTQLALREQSPARTEEKSPGTAGSTDSLSQEYSPRLDPNAFWPFVDDGDELNIVYAGRLPSAEDFRTHLYTYGVPHLREVHGLLRIRRAGNRSDFRDRLEAVYALHPVIATLALACQYCSNRSLLHRDKEVLHKLLADTNSVAIFDQHNLDDLFFRPDKGTFHVEESEAALTPVSHEGSGHRRGSSSSKDGSEASSEAAEMRSAMAELKAEMAAMRAAASGGGGGGGGSGHVPAADVAKLVQDAVAAEREQFITDVRSGKIVIDGHASKADRRAASTWQLSDEFAVFDSQWTEKRHQTENLYDASDVMSLRDLVYKNPTRDQDATKISKRHNFPAKWHDAPASCRNPAERKVTYTQGQMDRDKELREKQEGLLPPFKTTIKSLDICCRLHALADELYDDLENDRLSKPDILKIVTQLVTQADDAIFVLSDTFHLQAKPVTGFQKERRNILLQAKSVLKDVAMPDNVEVQDEGTWYMDDDNAIETEAVRLRAAEKQRKDLARLGGGGAAPPGGGSKNKQKKQAFVKKREADRERSKAAAKAAAAKAKGAPAPAPAPGPAPSPAPGKKPGS